MPSLPPGHLAAPFCSGEQLNNYAKLRSATFGGFRFWGREVEAKRQVFDELIAEIRDLKTGAFAPLSDQPLIRAVLFPAPPSICSRWADVFSTFFRESALRIFLPQHLQSPYQ
jgi:hypothetical protein